MRTPPQLLLGFLPEPEETLDNFVTGSNRELLHTLTHIESLAPAERFIHLWGEPASGRSHLLRAMGRGPNASFHSILSGDTVPEYSAAIRIYAVDDVDRLDDAGAARLFNLINQCKQQPGAAVLTSAAQAPAQLNLREDLRTRLGWGLVFRVERLNDHDIEAALMLHARQIGVDLPPEVVHYLLTRFTRDMRFLTRLVEELDRYALAQHRPLTVPLVRDFMRTEEDPAHDA